MWLIKGNIKRETDSRLIAAQNNAIRTNHIKTRIDVLGTVTKGLIKRLEDLEINYCITEIGQNTEKSPGNLRKLTVTQTPVKDHLLKTLKE